MVPFPHDQSLLRNSDNYKSMRNLTELLPKAVCAALMCPACRGELHLEEHGLSCTDCQAIYQIRDGVPLLAIKGSASTWGSQEISVETSESYQEQYFRLAEAKEYNLEYKQRFLKRLSTKREFRLLQRLLSSQGIVDTILDLPCGGGRLSPQIAPYTKLLIEADIAEGQVMYGRDSMRLPTQQVWMTASAFHIPFKNESIDGIVCCRLNHHLPTAAERERLIQELLRVSRRFVVMTFFDYYSPKNRLRQLRRPFNRKPPKMTMTIKQVKELAEKYGARLVAFPSLSWIGSGHRYAMMVKNA